MTVKTIFNNDLETGVVMNNIFGINKINSARERGSGKQAQ